MRVCVCVCVCVCVHANRGVATNDRTLYRMVACGVLSSRSSAHEYGRLDGLNDADDPEHDGGSSIGRCCRWRWSPAYTE